MQLLTPISVPLLHVFLSLLSISTTTAAPKTSSPPPAGATPDDKCRPCLARELRTVPKCGLLSPSTPALPSSENNAVIIQMYKDTYPDAVDCLCLAAKWTEVEGGPQDWISRCNNVCTVAVFKNQKMVLEAFQKQLSCGSDSDSEGKGKVEAVSGDDNASRNSPQSVSQTLGAPPDRKPANEAPTPAPPAPGINAAAPSAPVPKLKEVTVTEPDPNPTAAAEKESIVAAASTSNTTPYTKDSKTGGDAKPAL
ncbi:hypothetical protein BKA57DRAFT_513770 [Linnemannia elongata]|nr:hypothetical protein BKA57DRAFT_513770 [Linnemannia elongata]